MSESCGAMLDLRVFAFGDTLKRTKYVTLDMLFPPDDGEMAVISPNQPPFPPSPEKLRRAREVSSLALGFLESTETDALLVHS